MLLFFFLWAYQLDAVYESSTVDVWWWTLHGFARWDFVEIGINETWGFGWNLSFQPTWYHATASRAPNNKIWFISNPQDNNWASFDGDFFTPWTPLEGFWMTIGTTNYNNNTNGVQDIPWEIRGSNTLVRWGKNVAQLTWSWAVAGLDIERVYSISEDGLYILMETTLTNTTWSDINNIYWHQNVDPDNDQSVWWATWSYSTNNKILSQYTGSGTSSLVIATQNPGQAHASEPDGSAVSLYTRDPRGKATYGGFNNDDAKDIYDVVSPLVATVWSELLDDDKAISLAFNIGTISAGQSTELIYAYNLSDDVTDLEVFAALMEEDDADNDGLVTSQETAEGTDPNDPDTDGDGEMDGAEVAVWRDPLVDDTPIITLIWSGSINIDEGTSYTDAGATFSDNIDGTGSLVGSGSVDINTPGTYIITYDYTDSHSIDAVQVTRTVVVEDVPMAGTSEVWTLDSVHYVPPFYARAGLSTSGDVQKHYLVLSTHETTSFDVGIQNAQWYNGSWSAQVSQTVSISKSSPLIIDLSASPYGSNNYGWLGIVTDGELNTPDSENGLILTSASWKRFYANIRHSSGSQGTSLTTKGQTALWQRFRSWHLHQNNQQDSVKSHFISVMAVEDNTTVNFWDISTGITFVWGSTNPWPVTLNKYESYTVWVRLDQFSNLSVLNDLNGTLVTSDKAIVMTTGSFLWWAEWGWRDIWTDQIVPVNYLGTQFILVEGSWGVNANVLETPIIVADTDDTEIYLKGSATPIATIDAWEYYIISGNEYPASGSMFIRTSEPAYVYQSTSSNTSNGNGMSFIAAVKSTLETQDVVIADADQLGTPIIYIVAPTTATVTVDSVTQTGWVAVPGTANFVLYTITWKSANVDISSTEWYFVSMTSVSWARGAAGFYSGFPNSYALKDITTTRPGTTTTIDVLANDVVGTNNFTVSSIPTPPLSGTASILPSWEIEYTPNPSFTGVDTFTYEIDNGLGVKDVAQITVAIDNDGDGVWNADDLDDDNDGILDSVESLNGDTDGDGVDDIYDLDSDNDGIYDSDEAGHNGTDANNDGILDGFAWANGLVDEVETVAESGTINYTLWDQDTDLLKNYRDLDSDGDGIPDNVEAQSFTWYILPSYTYTSNGIHISYSGWLIPVNTDGDALDDYLDTDSDNEWASDTGEAWLTLSGSLWTNGLIASMETVDNYTDVNGTLNDTSSFPDDDFDGITNVRDDFLDNLAPTDLSFTGSIDENSSVGTIFGTFSTVDPDVWDAHNYSLVAGSWDNDNALFTITGSSLIIQEIPDFEIKSTYSIRIETSDGKWGTYSESVAVQVNDLDEISPIFSSLSLSSNNADSWYAKEWDQITFSLTISPADTWGTSNNIDFSIGSGSSMTSSNYAGSSTPITTRDVTYTVQAGDDGSIVVDGMIFVDELWNTLTWVTFPHTPSSNVIVDTTPPSLSFSGWVDVWPTQSDIITIDVADINLDNSTLEYWFSADTTCDASDTFGNSFSTGSGFTIDTETQNGNYICARAIDEAGNIGYLISTNSLSIDITNPAVPVISSPWDNSVDNDTTPTIEWTWEAWAIVNVEIDGLTYTWAVDWSWDWSIDITPSLTDDDYTVSVFQTDEAGNDSSSVEIEIEIDTVEPGLSEITAIPSPDNDATPNYTFTTDEAWDITYGGSCSSTTSTWSIGTNTITLNSLSDGLYTSCTITMTDEAGNDSFSLPIPSFIIDTTAPVITLTGSGTVTVELGDSYTDDGATATDLVDGNMTTSITTVNPVNTSSVWSYSVTYDVTDTAWNDATQVTRTVNVVDTTAPTIIVNDDVLVWPVQTDTVNISVTDLDLSTWTLEYGFSSDTTCNGSDTFWNTFVSGGDIIFNDETHTWKYLCFMAADVTGNTTYQISANPLNIDITPPSPPSSTDMDSVTDSWESDSDENTSDTTPDFSGTCTDGETVTLYIDGVSDSSVVCSWGVYTLTPDDDLSEGESEITVTFTDVAGNESDKSPALTITIDTQAPDIPEDVSLTDGTDSWDSSSDERTNDTTPIIEWTGEPGSMVSVTVDGESYTGSVDGSGDFSVEITSDISPDWEYQVEVTLTDTAGNISSTREVDLVVDTINNTPTITTPIEEDDLINITESTDVLVEWIAEPDSTVTVIFDDGVNTPINKVVTTDNSGNWTLTWSEVDITSFDEWDIDIFVTSTDVAGNTSSTASVSVEYDSSIPERVGEVWIVPTDGGAKITWQTNESASSEIVFWLTTVVDETTGELNIAPRVTSHSVELTDLLSCTIYFFQAISRDTSWNELVDGIYEFRTTGCAGGADITADITTDVVDDTTWGMVELTATWADVVEIELPTGYNASHSICSAGAYFQLKQLEEQPVLRWLGYPDRGFTNVNTYELSAYCDRDTRVTSFDEVVKITMEYTNLDVINIRESTIVIYRFNTTTGKWDELDNCSVNVDANTVTCETTNFSTFSIFGKTKGSAWRVEYDRCDGIDTSGSIYDGRCSEVVYETKTVAVNTEEEASSSENDTSSSSSSSSSTSSSTSWGSSSSSSSSSSDSEETSEGNTQGDSQDTTSSLDELLWNFEEEEFELQSASDDGIYRTIVHDTIQEYTLENNFDSCGIVEDINNEAYIYTTNGVFTDENLSQYKQEILKFKGIGIVDWYADASFQPQKEISRTEFLKVVLISHCYEYRSMDTSNLQFNDIDTSSWQARVIAKSIELGIANGDIDEFGIPIFRPDDIITKAEAVKILMRMSLVQSVEPDLLLYSDVIVDWHKPYVRTWQTLGLFDVEQDKYQFSPDGWVTRENMIHLIKELVELYQ